jgi:hypothetical protein
MEAKMTRKKVREEFVRRALLNWDSLNKHITEMRPLEVLRAIELEDSRIPVRGTFVRRLRQRYNRAIVEEASDDV